MGLDVYVVKSWASPVGAFNGGEDEAGNAVYPDGGNERNHADFAARGEGLPRRPVIVADEGHSFGAGAYSYYNRWRNALAEIAGYPEQSEEFDGFGSPRTGADVGAWHADGGPFWELIKFSDCEGVLGPVVCKKLLQDFRDYAGKATEQVMPNGDFVRLYNDFHRAIEEAAESNGAVIFS
jgi:hypothetical protein